MNRFNYILIFFYIIINLNASPPKYEYDEAGNRVKLNDHDPDCFDNCLCPVSPYVLNLNNMGFISTAGGKIMGGLETRRSIEQDVFLNGGEAYNRGCK